MTIQKLNKWKGLDFYPLMYSGETGKYNILTWGTSSSDKVGWNLSRIYDFVL